MEKEEAALQRSEREMTGGVEGWREVKQAGERKVSRQRKEGGERETVKAVG